MSVSPLSILAISDLTVNMANCPREPMEKSVLNKNVQKKTQTPAVLSF